MKRVARWSLFAVLLGCKANALVVVSVDATSAIDNVATLAGTASAAGRTVSFSVTPAGGGSVSIPPQQTFGIDVPTSITGSISVHIDARDPDGNIISSGDGAGTISAGRRSDLTVTLGPEGADMAMADDGSVDMTPSVLTMAPATFDFGPISKNMNGIMKTFTVTNTGNADIAALPAAMIAGAASAAFTIVTDGCNQKVLKAGDTCTVTLQFTPKVAGVLGASLTVSAAAASLVGTSFGAFVQDSPMFDLSVGSYSLTDVWGSGPNDVYVSAIISGSNGGIYHRDGAGLWTSATVPVNTPKLVALWGFGANDIYAAGGSSGGTGALLLHSTGNGAFTQSFYFSQSQANDVWGTADNDLYLTWMGGTAPPAAHYGVWHSIDATTFTAQTTAPDNQQSIWGSSASDVYVVGGGILHSPGNGAWTSQNATANLKGVWGSSATDVYVVGANGVILHSKGDGTWQTQTAPLNDYYAVWGSGPTDVWVVGSNGSILRSVGDGNWNTPVLSNTSIQLNSVWGSSSGDFWVVGASNTILHYH